uniref:Uncharacterized protein n=1 Tax=Solibacter usitatus (strain Ellin6076) TaxID=234267 RepID=Q02BA1_SOLUE
MSYMAVRSGGAGIVRDSLSRARVACSMTLRHSPNHLPGTFLSCPELTGNATQDAYGISADASGPAQMAGDPRGRSDLREPRFVGCSHCEACAYMETLGLGGPQLFDDTDRVGTIPITKRMIEHLPRVLPHQENNVAGPSVFLWDVAGAALPAKVEATGDHERPPSERVTPFRSLHTESDRDLILKTGAFNLVHPLPFVCQEIGVHRCSAGKTAYMNRTNPAGVNSEWQIAGTWTVPSAPVTADSVTPSSGSGSTQTFALQYSATAGATSFSTVWAWFNSMFSASAANTCMVYYDRAASTLYLVNDAGTQWLPGTPGAAATLQNSQCSINLATTNVALVSNTLTLNLATTFKPVFAGPKNIYMYGAAGATNSGWQARGTWTATSGVVTVSADSVTPSSGTGSTQTFALQYSDTAGATNFSSAWAWFNDTFSASAANSCLVYYDRAASTLYLINDAGTQWLPGTPGAAATLQNSQCSINLATTSAALVSNTLTLKLATTFKPAYASAKNIYMYGAAGATNSGWQTRGTWTATSGIVTVTADSVTPSSGSGSTQTFALQYSDTAGATTFSTAWAWFNATFSASAANSCLVYYDRAASTLYLINDAGTQWLPGTPGAAATLQNSQCSINLASTSVAFASNTLTLNLPLTFRSAYAGGKTIYMYGADTGTNSGWQTRGTWTAQ